MGVSNSFKSKEKADQEQNIEKCTKSKTSFWKSPAVSCNINGTTVGNIKSNIMKVTKKKNEPTSNGVKAKKEPSPKISWKGKCVAAKEHVANSLKSKAKGGQQETKKKKKGGKRKKKKKKKKKKK